MEAAKTQTQFVEDVAIIIGLMITLTVIARRILRLIDYLLRVIYKTTKNQLPYMKAILQGSKIIILDPVKTDTTNNYHLRYVGTEREAE
jgi:hypothetical protein